MRLIEVRTAVNPVDLPPTGASSGDEFVLAGKLRNAANTTDVGTANDVRTVLSSSGSPLHCVSVITLKAGTISLAGIVSGGPRFTLAITGGTGAYDEVHGQVPVTQGPNGTGLVKLDIRPLDPTPGARRLEKADAMTLAVAAPPRSWWQRVLRGGAIGEQTVCPAAAYGG